MLYFIGYIFKIIISLVVGFIIGHNFKAENEDNIIAKTTYHEEFASVVGKENILGVQFHPEKSQGAGQMIIKNFLKYE